MNQLSGKYKVWCYQFTLYKRVMWPLKMSEIDSSTKSNMDRKANSTTVRLQPNSWAEPLAYTCVDLVGISTQATLTRFLSSICKGH